MKMAIGTIGLSLSKHPEKRVWNSVKYDTIRILDRLVRQGIGY